MLARGVELVFAICFHDADSEGWPEQRPIRLASLGHWSSVNDLIDAPPGLTVLLRERPSPHVSTLFCFHEKPSLMPMKVLCAILIVLLGVASPMSLWAAANFPSDRLEQPQSRYILVDQSIHTDMADRNGRMSAFEINLHHDTSNGSESAAVDCVCCGVHVQSALLAPSHPVQYSIIRTNPYRPRIAFTAILTLHFDLPTLTPSGATPNKRSSRLHLEVFGTPAACP